jgi:hypothetical protein
MRLSPLDQNEKLALLGSVTVLLAGLMSGWGGLVWVAIAAALAMAVVVIVPRVWAAAPLPGSRGTLMATLGVVALAAAAIELSRWISYVFNTLGMQSTLAFLIGIAGVAVMAYAGWNALQSEGGRWRFGTRASRASDATASAGSADDDDPT